MVHSSRYGNKIFFIAFSIVISALVIDTTLVKIYSFSTSIQSLPNWAVIVFLVVGSIYTVGQYVILLFVKKKSNEVITKPELHLHLIYKVITIVQSALTVLFVSLIVEIIVTSHYDTFILSMATGISYTLSIIMIGLLAQRFFSWFKTNRNSVVFFYGLSSGILAINAAFSIAFVDLVLSDRPASVYPHTGTSSAPFIVPGSAEDLLNNLYVISSLLSFMVWWVATVLLLRGHFKRLGRTRYWISVSIPLVYFLSQFLPLSLTLFSALPLTQSASFFIYEIVFTLSKPAGGILFGVAFWAVARSLGNNAIVREYMTISAYGLVLLFVSNQAIVLINIAYPPFGLATVSFMGLSAYLVLVGIYSSAISVSEDSKLRQSIRSFALRESKLLDSIGTAHMEQEIQRRVIKVTREQQKILIEKSGIQSSLTEDDIHIYLEQVINEVKKQKPKSE